MDKERELFKKYICTYCIKEGCGYCYAPIKRNKGCKTIQCINYRKKNIHPETYSSYIRYTYYDETGMYIAIIKMNTPTNVINKIKSKYDFVRYKEWDR